MDGADEDITKKPAKLQQEPDEDSGGKGKGNSNGEAVLERLQKSSRAMLGALAGSHQELPVLASSSKEAGASSHSSAAASSLGTSSVSENRSKYGSWEPGNSFRAPQTTATIPEDEFGRFLDAGQTLPPMVAPSSTETSLGNTYIEAGNQDGAAVVQLLSEFDAQEGWDAQDAVEDDDFVSSETAAKIRAALFDSPSSRLSWDHLLNFNPNFTGNSETDGTSAAEMHMGMKDSGAATALWFEQWSTVLSAYTDEVWGDISPLVAQARQETLGGPAESTGKSPESTALSRLQQILAHVRGRA